MGVDFKKTSHIILFAGVMPLLSLLIAWLFSKILPSLPYWVDTLSPIYGYGLIYLLFDRYLWRCPIFTAFGIVSIPNLNRRWKGKQRSSYQENGKNVEVKGCLEIEQTFSSVLVRGYYEKSKSESVVCAFTKLNSEIYLFYAYDNDPNTLKCGTMQQHKGSGKIRYLPADNRIEGFYWNSIGNQGDMFFEYETTELRKRF
ncbi:hypothetical protein HYU89_01930 [Candidatus Collierbacteria bacterium]|nr:hypothetical protein [Candidatus Collierbacteria bacterium]